MPSVGQTRALKRCNAMEGLHSNWKAQAKRGATVDGAVHDGLTSQSSIPKGVMRTIYVPADSERDSPSDLVRRTKDVRYSILSSIIQILTGLVLDER